MLVINEKQEAIACIRMAVDNNNLAQLNSDTSDDDVDLEVDPEFESRLASWISRREEVKSPSHGSWFKS
jgi:uncharacterized OB-fold protein